MPKTAGAPAPKPAVFTIPSHRSFADSLVAGLLARFGSQPLSLARGRILLPNNRAVRSITDAFVRASGGGLVLPRLIPIGDPELEERIGGALDPAGGSGDEVPPAVDPLARLLVLAELLRGDCGTAAEAMRMAADLGRTLDALLIEEVDPQRLKDAVVEDLARHWQVSLERLRAILLEWPERLKALGAVDLAQRRNLLLHRLARRWTEAPPPGFTVAAGITTAAPAVAALVRAIAYMPDGLVVLPGLSLPSALPEEEWVALAPEEGRRGEQTHPQFHLRQLLDRLGVNRAEVRLWPRIGRASSPAARGRAVTNAMTAADFTHKWNALAPAERRLTGIRVAELPDSAAEAQAVALAIRGSLETPGKTVALVTPDRVLARRVSALLSRWNIEADDSAGRAISELPAGTLLLSIAGAIAEALAPVPLLALLKHPLIGSEGDARLAWLDDVRSLDLALRGPRPAPGIDGLNRHFVDQERERRCRGCLAAWQAVRPKLEHLERRYEQGSLAEFAKLLTEAAEALAGDKAWRGQDGRIASELLTQLQVSVEAHRLNVTADDGVAILRQLLEAQRVRPPYGGHPRVFIWGLLEARLQQADLMILGGLNEGVWPAAPAPDPWLAPAIRASLGLPGLEYRVGLSAHDFASALGAPEVLITRAKRDQRSPTVASRLWLRLKAMTGGLPHDVRLERLAVTLDEPAVLQPTSRPQPCPPVGDRPKRISVTSVDRLKADPFAFYAREMLKLHRLDPVDADHSAAWKGTAVHGVLEQWLADDNCDPDKLMARARALLADQAIHPMLRALWLPRLIEAIRWIESQERANQAQGRLPLAAEKRGEAEIAEVLVHGKADRLDRLVDGTIAIVDYKTGKSPAPKAIEGGFALQLGLLGLIAERRGFEGVDGRPSTHEYWSLTKYGDTFGKCVCPDAKEGAVVFLDRALRSFTATAGDYLTGQKPFVAKLNPAFAPYGDYDQLMRLEEWYGRS